MKENKRKKKLDNKNKNEVFRGGNEEKKFIFKSL